MSIIEEKAARMLAEGRVTVLEARHGQPAKVRVEGDHGVYQVVHLASRVVCPCPAWVRRCSHAAAVELVTETQA